MTQHNLYYFPYGSFADPQLPLLKVAALYFDKLFILDPVGASWLAVGADRATQTAVRELSAAGILQTIAPATVLNAHDVPLAAAILRDVDDPDFVKLCTDHSRETGKDRWRLSLAKVPSDVQSDSKMRTLLGDLARKALRAMGRTARPHEEHERYDETEVGAILDRAARFQQSAGPDIAVFDEVRQGYVGDSVEYRSADFPLALGEAIMINHALFAGVVQANATPITDDAFHDRALALKLRKAAQDPALRTIVADRARERQFKSDHLAVAALRDSQLTLPILDPALPLPAVLEYRLEHNDALQQARERLGWMARTIESQPWTEELVGEIEHKTIPALAKELKEAERARDGWLESKRGKLALKGTGIVVGTANAVLSIVVAPITPVALLTAVLGITTASAIPGLEWLLDWREGKNSAQENGLHYFLKA